jgi:hypothetical protein
MNMSSEARREGSATAQMATAYQLELAVGASHVASKLYPAPGNACIEELAASFAIRHGMTDLKRFLTALADRLDARANPEGALAVRTMRCMGQFRKRCRQRLGRPR